MLSFKKTSFITLLAACLISLASCGTIDLYEKVVSIPKMEWHSSYQPEFSFEIKDTAAAYQVYVVVRHTGRYNWNNIWINLHSIMPATDSLANDSGTRVAADTARTRQDSVRVVQYELPLANKERWLGTAMGDVYEHRVLITPQAVKFPRPGRYRYKIEQAMREDPLKHVLNVGLRVEKKT